MLRPLFWILAAVVVVEALASSPALAKKPQWTGESCSIDGAPFAGRTKRTANENKALFMMFSAYRLLPYDQTYIDNTLKDLGRTGIAGVVYTGLGGISKILHKKGSRLDEIAYNKKLYEKARQHRARLWLQIRVFQNNFSSGKKKRNHTVSEILQSKTVRQAFLARLRKEFSQYNQHFSHDCRVIVNEEAGIYHHPDGGGTFWSSSKTKIRKRHSDYDELFASNWARLFRMIKTSIRKINPDCQVGSHVGHGVFLNQPVFLKWINWLKERDDVPDFLYYGFALKAQKHEKNYEKKLTRRKLFATDTLNIPLLHMAQLHTMNNFQSGLGRTPSKREIDDMISLDDRLGMDGVGFYTKNATKTRNFKNNPLAPNLIGQQTVYESSKDRWDYGLLKLYEKTGINYKNHFDLVLHGRFTADRYTISLKNRLSGKWEFLGIVNPTIKNNYLKADVIVFRNLKRTDYLMGGRKLAIRVTPTGSFRRGFIKGIFIIPTEPPEAFRSAVGLKKEIDETGQVSSATAAYFTRIPLKTNRTQIKLCTDR